MQCTLRPDRVMLRGHGYIFLCLCQQECFLFITHYGLHHWCVLHESWVLDSDYIKSVSFIVPERRWFMEMFRNKMSFVSGGVCFECFHKLITTHSPKATFVAGLAESGSTSTAVSLTGISFPNILATWSISVMCSHQPHLERCEVAVGTKQGLHAGPTAPLEKAFSKSCGDSQRHWWQSSQYLLLSQSCTCRLFVQNQSSQQDCQRIFFSRLQGIFQWSAVSFGEFSLSKTSHILMVLWAPLWTDKSSVSNPAELWDPISCAGQVVAFLWVNSDCLCDDIWTSVFQKPRIRMNSWKFCTRRWSCCRLHTVKHYGISWHIWRGGCNSCEEL